jgi:hypothetical protein
MEFWRVFNWNHRAKAPGDNGHPLFVWPRQGVGRINDPQSEYLVLHVGDSAAGAVAEAFGRFPRWTKAILDPPPGSPPRTFKALAKYSGTPRILDLDDPFELQQLGLRPSRVVSRDRASTQWWARDIYETHSVDGVSWWSYYDPDWTSIGLWDWSALKIDGDPEVLDLDHPAVMAAADTICRIIG